jgi:hypothetical protein
MPNLVKLWIIGSAFCVLTGWLLSAIRQLNLLGYSVAFGLAILWLALGWRRWRGVRRQLFEAFASGVRRKRRFRRLLPALFLVSAALAGIGGALHAPNNYDALAYRFPRILHWLSGNGWGWVATPTMQVNYAGTVFEWLMTPLFLFSHGDRLVFLIDWISYLFLPGLIFSVFVGCGVSRRVAWAWMWPLPLGFCYVMQAGSIGNDLAGAVYVLAAMAFGLRGARNANARDLWLGILAAGLATGVKASNLPLLLPFVWAVAPAWKLARDRIIPTIAVVALALAVSFLPNAILNYQHTGSWTGDPENHQRFQPPNPWSGIVGGSLELAGQSLQPPLVPYAHRVESAMRSYIPSGLRQELARDFPSFGFALNELPQEEGSSMGLGITIGVLLSFCAMAFGRRDPAANRNTLERQRGKVLGALAWLALLVFMAELSLDEVGRLLSPYYGLLLLPLVLHRSQEQLVRAPIWKTLAVCIAASAWMALILTPARPLWPAEKVFNWLARECPENPVVARGQLVYGIYGRRNDLFASLRQRIPSAVTRIGVIQPAMNPETSFWRPFGRREVVDFRVDDLKPHPPAEWWVIKQNLIPLQAGQTASQWFVHLGGAIVAEEQVQIVTSAPPETWYVVHFEAQPVL